MKLRSQLTVSISATTMLVITVFAVVMLGYQYRDEYARFRQKIEINARLWPEFFRTPLWDLDERALRTNADAIFLDEDIIELTVSDEFSTILYHGARKGVGKTVSQRISVGQVRRTIGTVEVIYSLGRVDSAINAIALRFCLLTLVLLLFLDGVVFFSAYSITNPLSHLVEALKTIGSGNFDVVVPAAVHGELGILADSVRSMSAELKTRESTIRYVTEAAHEAELKLRLESQKLEIEREGRLKSEALRAELEASLENLRRTQERLIASEKMAALGGLVAGVAHEVNTPIGISVTAASFLREQAKAFSSRIQGGEIDQEYLDAFLSDLIESTMLVENNLRRAAEIIRSFKHVSVDQTSGAKRSFDVSEYLQEVVRSLAPRFKNKPIEIHIACQPALVVSGYPGALSQIVTNLLLNSLIHGFRGRSSGSIELSVALAEKSILELRIRDDGNGMAQEDLEHLFEPFHTSMREAGGTGLGTYIVYNIVTQKLGGTIEAKGALGAGLAYLIRFPVETVGGSA